MKVNKKNKRLELNKIYSESNITKTLNNLYYVLDSCLRSFNINSVNRYNVLIKEKDDFIALIRKQNDNRYKSLEYPDNSTYFGMTNSDNQRDGFGIYSTIDKDLFIGYFSNDLYRNGILAKYKSKDDIEIFSGEFRTDIFSGVYVPSNTNQSTLRFMIGQIYLTSSTSSTSNGIYCYDSPSQIEIYLGNIKDDIKEGKDSYIITFMKDENSKTTKYKDISVVKGEFKKDNPYGKTICYNGGDSLLVISYSEQFTIDRIEAVYYKFSDGIYYGELKLKDEEYKPDGKGTIVYEKSAIYTGMFKDGKKNGEGKNIIDIDKCKVFIEGMFDQDDIKVGKIYKDSFAGELVYEGEFENNRIKRGKYYFGKDEYYEGEFINNKRNGNGKYCYSDGSVFEGLWKDGKKNGNGVLKDSKGKANMVFGKMVKDAMHNIE